MLLLNPLYLLGLAALAVPVIIHLVRRTRATPVEFASLRFVRRIPQRTIQRKQLHNLLLLALRSLAIFLAVLAFARPFFNSSQAESQQKDRSHILLFDTSLSMRYGKRFEQAKARAQAVLTEIQNERVALIGFDQKYQIHSRFTTETAHIRTLINELQPGLGGTDYSQALRGAESLFAETGKGEKHLHLISDFQAVGQGTDHRLSREIRLNPIDIGEDSAPNLAITDISAHPVIYQQKYTDSLIVRLSNFSPEDRKSVWIELRINDYPVEKRELNIASGESQNVEFTGFNLIEGINRCQIEISDDSFPIDNKFYFTLRRATQFKALIIETAVRGQSESFYLRHALATGENLPFALAVKSVGLVDPNELNGYRVIVLNDAGDLNPVLAMRLIKFVENGGGLIIATGPHTQVDQFNRLLEPIIPAILSTPIQERKAPTTISEVKLDHTIFEVFRQSGQLSSTRFSKYFRAIPREASSVLARFEDGSPTLIESALNNGKVILFTSTLDATWNDLPLTPNYLPLIRQVMRYLGERNEKSWHLVGQSFTVPAAEDGALPAVDAPSGTRLTEKIQTALGDLIINPSEIGFYRLRYSAMPEFAAVNLDSKESDLKKLDVQQYTAAVSNANPNAAQVNSMTEVKSSNEEIESRQRIWQLLLIATVFLFISEALLARRLRGAS